MIDLLQALLVGLAVGALFAVTVVAALVALAVVATGRAVRIDKWAQTGAPRRWLWSPSAPAKYHRRLRAAVRMLGRRVDVAPDARRVRDEAVALDVQISAVSRLPVRARMAALHALAPAVREVEVVACRLAGLRPDLAPPTLAGTGEGGLADVRERLDALDAARAEVAAVERTG